MSTSAKFHIIYDGPALKENNIDVKDLAPSLLALSETIEEANNILNRGRAKVALNIRASFKSGSFGVDLSLFQDVIDNVLRLFKNDDIIAAGALLAFLGINIKGGVIGLIRVIKWMAGRKISSIQLKKNGKALIQIDDDKIETEKEVIDLLESHKVRKSLEKAIAVPLETDGIESVTTTDDPNNKRRLVTIKKGDRQYFITPEEGEELEDKTYETHLQLISPVFQEGNKWKFTEGNGPFRAEIKDQLFVNKVQDSSISFSSGDILIVKLRKRQYLEKGKIKSEYEVIKVLDHRSTAKQIKLPFKGTRTKE